MSIDSEIFVAGVISGAVLGVACMVSPRLLNTLLWLAVIGMAYQAFAGGGLSGLETAVSALIDEASEHRLFAFGFGTGGLLAAPLLHGLFWRDCAD